MQAPWERRLGIRSLEMSAKTEEEAIVVTWAGLALSSS